MDSLKIQTRSDTLNKMFWTSHLNKSRRYSYYKAGSKIQNVHIYYFQLMYWIELNVYIFLFSSKRYKGSWNMFEPQISRVLQGGEKNQGIDVQTQAKCSSLSEPPLPLMSIYMKISWHLPFQHWVHTRGTHWPVNIAWMGNARRRAATQELRNALARHRHRAQAWRAGQRCNLSLMGWLYWSKESAIRNV